MNLHVYKYEYGTYNSGFSISFFSNKKLNNIAELEDLCGIPNGTVQSAKGAEYSLSNVLIEQFELAKKE